jgi:hypothetical protein
MLGFPLGILSAAGAGGIAVEPAYELIATEILGSSQASVTFSSLGDYSSTYKHLQIRATIRNTGASFASWGLRFNGDTSSSYSRHSLSGNGSGVGSGGGANESSGFIGGSPTDASVAGSFGGIVIDILDPFSTSKNTTTRNLNGYATDDIGLVSTLWINTTPVSSMTIYSRSGGNIRFGSRFSLYGIKG